MSVTFSVGEARLVPVFPGGYAPPPDVYDEFFAEPGVLRPACQVFAQALNQMGADELSRRWRDADRWMYENGMAHGALGGGEEVNRPWNLDPLPFVLGAAEWKQLAAGLIQRAQVLNATLADLYGPQRLLAEGALPPELLFSHPAFMRPAYGQHPPGGRFLTLYAADLVRDPAGTWRVVADRTDAPFGAGYALENRLVATRMLPGAFQQCHVERIASYFIALRETLRALAPQHGENPRIVLLTVGPKHPGYFEDAFLSRYLGYTLVEGGDLAVRNNRVMLKTLGGLLQVDVILRRMTDQHCDPLELRGDPALGVPGLLQAARSGHVVLANALGSGLVESPAFLPFLPALCQKLLGAELQLPSLTSWWCGQEEIARHVRENLDRMQLRPAYRLRGRQVGGPDKNLSGSELVKELERRPQRVVAQEPVELSSAPTWTAAGLAPARITMRCYLVASEDSYVVLPGGLVRYGDGRGLEASILAGQGSKDAWVLADGPVKEVSLLRGSGQAVELRRSGAELPSRVADDLFWLGRQVERAEGAARFLRTVLVRLTSEVTPANVPELKVLLRSLAERGQIEPGFVVEGIRERMPAIEEALPVAAFDASQPGSLRSTLSAMYRLASIVRDRISIDSWRIISRIDQEFEPPQRRGEIDLAGLLAKINAMIIDLAAFAGLAMESMTRTQGWRFLDLGRRIERSLHTIELVRTTLFSAGGISVPVMEGVLEAADSSMTYRSRYLASVQLAPVLDLLLSDETNPRSLAYQLAALVEHVENLPRDRTQPLRSPEQRIALAALHAVRMMTLADLSELPVQGRPTRLSRLLAMLAERLPRLSELICHKYLIHAGVPQQMNDYLLE